MVKLTRLVPMKIFLTNISKYRTVCLVIWKRFDDLEEAEIFEDNVIKMPELDYVPSEHGMGYELFYCMKKNRHCIAQIDAETEQRDTFGNLLQRCTRTAIELKARGITSEDIICICSYNQLDNCVPYIAGLFIGAKICALDPSIAYGDSKHLLSQVNPKMIFVVAESRDMYEKLIDDMGLESELVIFGADDDDPNSFRRFLHKSPEEDDFVPVKVEDVYDTAIILFSSGTTGLAKGICVNHYAVLYQAKNFGSCGYNTRITLLYSSLYWISCIFVFIQSILLGTARIVCRSFNPLQAWYYIEKFQVTMMFGAPGQAIGMIKEGRPDGIDTSSLLDFIIGGGHLSPENLLSFRDLMPGTNVFLAYGLTEIAGCGLTFRTNLRQDVLLLDAKPKSCGRPVPGLWYKIVDAETEAVLGYNQMGELRLKGNCCFRGYHNMDSSGAWDVEGWLKTGDVAYYDEDFCFYMVDRIKEMLKFQSWHVAPAFLEGILQQHPAVKSAVVIGVPHDEDGEHPLGVVILLENAQGTEAETLVEYVNERVEDDRQKLRGGVVFVDEIPYTPSGKVKRRLLKEKILGNLST